MKKNLRKLILKNSFKSGACHIGSALSCVEICEAIYNIKDEKDLFIFGKASGIATIYCMLYGDNAWKHLKEHPLPSKEEGLIWSGGSLGMGLSVAIGLAISNRNKRVFCLLSDGEMQEGQTWEAILFAGQYKLDNLTVVIDRNRMQALGNTEDIIGLGDIARKVVQFGWDSFECDGHNRNIIENIISLRKNKPFMLVANTIKGKGVKFMENDHTWHYRNLDKNGYKKAIFQLDFKKSTKR